MAGDWIKIRKDLVEDPEVFAMAAELHLTREAVVGHLVRFWTWVDSHIANGQHRMMTDVSIDVVAGVINFADAMVRVGWLRVHEDGGITIPNFDRHLAKCAKRRALNMLYQRQHRVSKPSAKNLTREEKRRDVPPIAPQPPVSIPPELADLKLYAEDRKLCERWSELAREWRAAYPAVDIAAEVRKAHAWEMADPKHRKVNRPRFLNRWLARTQDNGGTHGMVSQPGDVPTEDDKETYRRWQDSGAAKAPKGVAPPPGGDW